MSLQAVEYIINCANCDRKMVIKVVPKSNRWQENFVCPYCQAIVTVNSDLEQKPGYEH